MRPEESSEIPRLAPSVMTTRLSGVRADAGKVDEADWTMSSSVAAPRLSRCAVRGT